MGQISEALLKVQVDLENEARIRTGAIEEESRERKSDVELIVIAT